MVTVIFHWITPKGFESPHAKKKILARWALTCKAFGINNLICVSEEDMHIDDIEVNFINVKTMDDALCLTEKPYIFVEQGGTKLIEYIHPKNGTYVFGSDYRGLPSATISIQTLKPVHAEIAAGIVLSHRFEQCPIY